MTDLELWLQGKGFKYWCFISWAHGGKELKTFIEKLHESLTAEFGMKSVFGSVFLDNANVKIGREWERTIAMALSQSVCLVPVVVPVYFAKERPNCGREWAAMELLSKHRLPDKLTSILPVKFREVETPETVSRLKWGDLSRRSMGRPDIHNTRDFRELVQEIVARAIEIAEAIQKHNGPVNHSSFRLPRVPSFIKKQPASLPKLPGKSS